MTISQKHQAKEYKILKATICIAIGTFSLATISCSDKSTAEPNPSTVTRAYSTANISCDKRFPGYVTRDEIYEFPGSVASLAADERILIQYSTYVRKSTPPGSRTKWYSRKIPFYATNGLTERMRVKTSDGSRVIFSYQRQQPKRSRPTSAINIVGCDVDGRDGQYWSVPGGIYSKRKNFCLEVTDSKGQTSRVSFGKACKS